MAREMFITSIRADAKKVAKDVGVYIQSLQPIHNVTSTFKKSSTDRNCMDTSSTHVFAAQAEKAVVHVYSRGLGNQEAIVAFPERLHCLALVHDGLLVLGTAEGRLILWEVCTGRQVSTSASHLQPVTCISTTPHHIVTGGADANIHVWSVARLLSLGSNDLKQPLRSLSNHRGAVTSIALGHSASTVNICVSSSRDNTCIIWNYHSGELIRTFLLPSAPLCVALDPCERAIYIGFEDDSIRSIEIYRTESTLNSLFDPDLHSTPIQIGSSCFSGSPREVGAVNCLGMSYDGAFLLSGHASGKVIKWATGPQNFSAELIDLNAPVTNIKMLPPFPEYPAIQAGTVVKPRLGQRDYTFTGKFVTQLGRSESQRSLAASFIPSDLLESAILEFAEPAAQSSTADEKLRKENEELWAIVKEQKALQRLTYQKFVEAKSGG